MRERLITVSVRYGTVAKFLGPRSRGAWRRDHLVHNHGTDIASRPRIIVFRLVLNARARVDTVAPSSGPGRGCRAALLGQARGRALTRRSSLPGSGPEKARADADEGSAAGGCRQRNRRR